MNGAIKDVSTPLMLHPDAEVTPAALLPPSLREQIDPRPGDYCVTRPGARQGTTVVSADLARLLDRFREPCSIVDAVLDLSAQTLLDPRELLEESFPSLAALIADGVLVCPDAPDAAALAASLQIGTLVDDIEIVELVHLLADTEVYRGRDRDGEWVALKLVRRGSARQALAALGNETAALARLPGSVTPRLVQTGETGQQPYLATTWREGVDLAKAAADSRTIGGALGRAEIRELVDAVLASYAALHAQGVVHGDVHPRNALVDADQQVAIIDLGLARSDDLNWRGPQGGIDLFMAPEIAAATLGGLTPPTPSTRCEQYSLAAMIFQLLTGEHTRAFSVRREAMLQQVITEPPRRFTQLGITGMEAVEAVLRRALSADPADRFESVAAFRDALATAWDDPANELAGDPPGRPPELLTEVLARLAPGGHVFAAGMAPPTASVTYGAAGVAYAHLRIAQALGDERLLALADLWAVRAQSALDRPDAIWDPANGIDAQNYGTCSLYHHESGVHLVRALVAHSQDDRPGRAAAVGDFIRASRGASSQFDVAFGAAGLLIGCAQLWELSTECAGEPLLQLGTDLMAQVCAELQDQPQRVDPRLQPLGAAHGRAGMLFAVMRWCQASGTVVPSPMGGWVDDILARAQPAGRGWLWPPHMDGPIDNGPLASSWCNGAAGLVHLFTLAQRILGDDRYGRAARRAAWAAYDGALEAPGGLCCGLAGRAYALLEMWRHTGEEHWRRRARLLAQQAAAHPRTQPDREDSLFHGQLGIAILAAELSQGSDDTAAVMPLVAAEGWPRGGAE